MSISPALQKLQARVTTIGNPLCIGLDSDFAKLPARFLNTTSPQFEFNKWIIEQTHQFTTAYKMNTAFYEARGAAGWQALEQTQTYLQENHPDVFTIADAKRADIGSTNQGYVTAFFDTLGFDAVTLHPYLGKEALQPFLDRKDKVSIILCKTSNPGSGEFQDISIEGEPLWKVVARTVASEWNEHGNCMVVVGATYPQVLKEVRNEIGDMWILVPGVGEQGGDMQTVLEQATSQDGDGVLVNVSRGIIFNEDPFQTAKSYIKGV
jgi:orotidine-5'-phosphate decarboxylase